jgi:hypothetical protein
VLHITISDIESESNQTPRRPFPWDSKPAALTKGGVKALAAVVTKNY